MCQNHFGLCSLVLASYLTPILKGGIYDVSILVTTQIAMVRILKSTTENTEDTEKNFKFLTLNCLEKSVFLWQIA